MSIPIITTRHSFCLLSFVFVFLAIGAAGQEPIRRKILLSFEGNNVFSEPELIGVAEKCLASDPRWQDRYNSETLDYCLSRLKFALAARGYLQASLGARREEETENGLRVIVPIEEGALYRIGLVDISGSKVFSSAQIREMMNLKTGDIANADNISVALFQVVNKAYSNLGYIQYTAEPVPQFSLKEGGREGVVDLKVTVDEGPMFKIRSIKFEGNANVPEDVLQQEMLVRAGDVFNQERFHESLKRIARAGTFEEINVDKDVKYRVNEESTALELTIHLKSRPPN